jgi:hypothetical protein
VPQTSMVLPSLYEGYKLGHRSTTNVDVNLLIGRNSEVVRDPMMEVIGRIRELRLMSRMTFLIRLALNRRSTLRMSTIRGSRDPGEGRQIAVRVTTVPLA